MPITTVASSIDADVRVHRVHRGQEVGGCPRGCRDERITCCDDVYLALLRGAAGADAELLQIFDETCERIVEIVVEGLGVSAQAPVVRTALRGWIGFVEESTLEWLRRGGLDQDALVGIQEQMLVRLIETVAPLALPAEPD